MCCGLAKNIVDTLFTGEEVSEPIVVCGGVSKNPAVLRHIRELIGKDLIVDEMSHLYGAFGAAIRLAGDGAGEDDGFEIPQGPDPGQKATEKHMPVPLWN